MSLTILYVCALFKKIMCDTDKEGKAAVYPVPTDKYGQGAVTHPDIQEQFALGTDRRPHPVGGPRETLNRFGCTHITVSDHTEHGIESVELDLIDL